MTNSSAGAPSEPARSEETVDGHETEIPEQFLGPVIESMEDRRNTTDQMMWQVPALSLTAQSFLLTISLAPDGTTAGKLIAASVGFVAAFAAVQLLLKHRYIEMTLSQAPERIEDRAGLPPLHGNPRLFRTWAWQGQEHVWDRASANPLRKARTLLVSWRSPTVWILMLCIFGLVDAGITIPISLGVL